jgi:hypothetical protein
MRKAGRLRSPEGPATWRPSTGLRGELEAEVAVPVAVVCAAVGLDPAALASVVRRLGDP